MVLVSFTPEAVSSFRRLPSSIRREYDLFLLEMTEMDRLRLPGRYLAHQLEGGVDLWTLKVGHYRGIFRWDGREARFIRFGERSRVYYTLPK